MYFSVRAFFYTALPIYKRDFSRLTLEKVTFFVHMFNHLRSWKESNSYRNFAEVTLVAPVTSVQGFTKILLTQISWKIFSLTSQIPVYIFVLRN